MLGSSYDGAVTGAVFQSIQGGIFTEYYVALRKMAKERNIPEAQQLNDIYLYRPRRREALDLAYADVIAGDEKAKEGDRRPERHPQVLLRTIWHPAVPQAQKERV